MWFSKKKKLTYLYDSCNTKQFEDGIIWYRKNDGMIMAEVYKYGVVWAAYHSYSKTEIGKFIDMDAAKLAVEHYEPRAIR